MFTRSQVILGNALAREVALRNHYLIATGPITGAAMFAWSVRLQ